jgi:phage baseplate assembly protein W
MTNFSVPFTITKQGRIGTTSNPNQIATDRVESLVGTFPGERVMQPNYGVDVPKFLFDADITAQTSILTTDVQIAVRTWEPTVVLQSVTPIVAQSDVGIVDISIDFTLSNDLNVTPVQTATIEVGGNVVDN